MRRKTKQQQKKWFESQSTYSLGAPKSNGSSNWIFYTSCFHYKIADMCACAYQKYEHNAIYDIEQYIVNICMFIFLFEMDCFLLLFRIERLYLFKARNNMLVIFLRCKQNQTQSCFKSRWICYIWDVLYRHRHIVLHDLWKRGMRMNKGFIHDIIRGIMSFLLFDRIEILCPLLLRNTFIFDIFL